MMSTSGTVITGWILCALTTVAIAASGVLAWHNSPNLVDVDFFPFVVVCGGIGSLIISRQPANLVGWFMSAGALSFALMAFSGHYAIYGLATDPSSLPAARAISWPQTWLWVPAAGMVFLLLPLHFPNGRLLSPRWRLVLYWIIAVGIFAAIYSAIGPGESSIQIRSDDVEIVNPLGVERLDDVFPIPLSILNMVMPAITFTLLCLVALSLILRYRR
jgi:hypothetical protein